MYKGLIVYYVAGEGGGGGGERWFSKNPSVWKLYPLNKCQRKTIPP